MVDVDVKTLAPHRSFCCWRLRLPLGCSDARARVKKLAILLLLVAATSCRRQTVVASPPGVDARAGAATPRRPCSVHGRRELQDLGDVEIWGSAPGGRDADGPRRSRSAKHSHGASRTKRTACSVRMPPTGERLLSVELKHRT